MKEQPMEVENSPLSFIERQLPFTINHFRFDQINSN